MMQKTIDEFRDYFYFLSNFYQANVVYNGIRYQNNEAAFQSMKCPERAEEFSTLNPSFAKSLGRHVKLREDWEHVKEQIMYEICLAKFTQNEDLKEKLLTTGDALLIEGNNWNDREWGVCNGEGKNKLGAILMKIRAEIM